MKVAEHEAVIAGVPVFWRSAGRLDGERAPVLYVHGVPSSSDEWPRFLARTGGLAPDLPGFGRSGKLAGWPYSIDGYDEFVEDFLEHVGVERVRLLVHDWGAVALAFAQRFPERIDRLVVADAVPLLPGYRWHWLARLWRIFVVGELTMGFTTKTMLRRLSKLATATREPLPDQVIEAIWNHFDHGTQRAILKLYRSAAPAVLAAAGSELATIEAPALVVWGEQDPYIGPDWADAYARRLPHAEVERVADAGHWPWLDRPEVAERIVAFLQEA